jgi:hypothetical protein
MKIRSGFVSNSSSSSFVCNVCGDSYEGMDACLSDADFFECINGHIVCHDDLMEDPNDEMAALEDNSSVDFRYEMPEKYCPICNFVEPDYQTIGKYFEKLYRITREEVFQEIKAQNKRRKKLYDNEYVTYVMAKNDINQSDLLKELKSKFTSFSDFEDFVRVQ